MKVKESGYLNEQELKSLTLDFVQCAIHQILYQRKVYPNEAFSCCQKYSLEVKAVRFTQVSDYIRSTLAQLEAVLIAGKLEAITLELFNASKNELVESFKFSFLPLTSKASVQVSGMTKQDVIIALRRQLAAVNRLNLVKTAPEALTDDTQNATFQIVAETKEAFKDPEWLGLQTQDWVQASEDSRSSHGDTLPTITPLCHFPTGLYTFQVNCIDSLLQIGGNKDEKA